MRVLVVSDTHVGYDLPARPRSGRRVRGLDFIANFERALAPAHAGEVDVVVHAGDVFDVPDPPPAVADIAYALLRQAAERVPVFVVPGNHERARLPCPLLAIHERVHVLHRPQTIVLRIGEATLAIGGFPYARRVRERFAALVGETGLLQTPADVRLLVVHHCIESAVVSLPDGGEYRFTDAPDVIAARELPTSIAALCSGHIHRHQCLGGLPVPVVYGGSVERTAFAEARETKGFVVLDLAPGGQGGALQAVEFHPLPARPMVRLAVDADRPDLAAQLRLALQRTDPDAIVRLELAGAPRSIPALSAASLRTLAPASMNLHVVFEDREPRYAPLSRSRRGRTRAASTATQLDLVAPS